MDNTIITEPAKTEVTCPMCKGECRPASKYRRPSYCCQCGGHGTIFRYVPAPADLAEALELAYTFFATTEEIVVEGLRKGEALTPQDAMEAALYALRPGEDEQLRLWLAVQTACEYLSTQDVVVLSKAA